MIKKGVYTTLGTENVRKERPVLKTHKTNRVDESRCGICLINWKDYKSRVDWIKCIKCAKWICGPCNGESTDLYYHCAQCGNCVCCTTNDLSACLSALELFFS